MVRLYHWPSYSALKASLTVLMQDAGSTALLLPFYFSNRSAGLDVQGIYTLEHTRLPMDREKRRKRRPIYEGISAGSKIRRD